MIDGRATLTIVAASIVPTDPIISTPIGIQRSARPIFGPDVIGPDLQRHHRAGPRARTAFAEPDAHRYALRDLREHAGRVGVGNERKLRGRRRADVLDLAFARLAR